MSFCSVILLNHLKIKFFEDFEQEFSLAFFEFWRLVADKTKHEQKITKQEVNIEKNSICKAHVFVSPN